VTRTINAPRIKPGIKNPEVSYDSVWYFFQGAVIYVVEIKKYVE
jgi:hypothetical protein